MPLPNVEGDSALLGDTSEACELEAEAPWRQRSTGRAHVVASGSLCLLLFVAGSALTGTAWPRRWGHAALKGQGALLSSSFNDTEMFTELYSSDCDWVPFDLCLHADPEKCRCRGLWRNGAGGARGFGPCGEHGEHDPCLIGTGPCVHSGRRLEKDACTTMLEAINVSIFGNKTKEKKHKKKKPKTGRKGSFLVIGDWGWDNGTHGNVMTTSCQLTIADAMLKTFNALGDVQFIINVGDSFYPSGVRGKWDPQWDKKWRNMFPAKLRSVPWYSTYGNHDYHIDPGVCSETVTDGAQINYNISDLDYFYMPGYNWYKKHSELDLEVVSLDMNQLMDAWNGKVPVVPADCQYTACPKKCKKLLHARTKEGTQLFHERVNKSKARNLLVFSHYPTDYLWAAWDPWKLIDDLKVNHTADGSPRHVEYFGGHRHNVDQDSTRSIWPNSNWLVGGGGGWSCDGANQGFVVGEIKDDFQLVTYSQIVDWNMCCGKAQFANRTQDTISV